MTPEEEEQVRRALASTPPEGPMPAEVEARLDATLAELVAHRAHPRADALPVPPGAEMSDELEARRRRRWPRVLVAAASVSVLAYGVGAVLDGMQGGAEMSTAARDESGADSGAAEEPVPEMLEPPGVDAESGDRMESPGAGVSGDQLLRSTRRARLDSATLATDVQRLVDRPAAATDTRSRNLVKDDVVAGALGPCEVPSVGKDDLLAAVRLDGVRATLVLRAPSDGTRVAEVYSCGDGEKLLALTRVDDGPARR